MSDAGTTIVEPDGEVYYYQGGFWWTKKGQIIRWTIFAIFFLFLAFIVIGYWHARQRVRKGLAPLRYHRWLLNRTRQPGYDPSYQNPSVFYQPYSASGQYGMHPMPQPMPPPMYDPNAPMPPTYQPPEGATKVDPSQWRSQPTRRPAEGEDPAPDYEAPAGPPPAAHIGTEHTGASTVSNNPYRV